MRKRLLICLALCALVSCKDPLPSPEPFEGITETLDNPTPSGVVDADDWKPVFACPPPDSTGPSTLPTCTRVFPVYPNPASGSTMLYFWIAHNDSVIITLYDRPEHLVSTLVSRRFRDGAYSYRLDLHGYELTVHRLYFMVIRPEGIYTTYGDIKLVQ
jgi:hypothetical protein